MFFSFVTSALGVVTIGFYLYVAVAVVYAERKASAGWGTALAKGFTWPATIWSTIEKLYAAR